MYPHLKNFFQIQAGRKIVYLVVTEMDLQARIREKSDHFPITRAAKALAVKGRRGVGVGGYTPSQEKV